VLGISACLSVAVLAACSSSGPRSGFGTDVNATENGPGSLGGGGPAQVNDCHINNTSTDMDTDFDGDGYPLKDDCNECNPSVNKGAHDIYGDDIDQDCSGTADDDDTDCDASLDKTATDPYAAAKAIGLCRKADPKGRAWGVTSAKWVKPDGTALGNMEGVGILDKFGVNLPQTGKSFLVLSSGSAREPGDPEYESSSNSKGYTHAAPQGYPKESPACPNVTTGTPNDGVALELKIRVPSNARSFSYQQFFFTIEYPSFICSRYNDFFVSMMTPKPAGLADGNIAFDQDTNPISVNNSLLQVCDTGTHGGKFFPCPLGNQMLSGTGFEEHAGTGWLTTTVPVEPGKEITLRFAIWDSGDGILDSTVLIDDFKFSIEGADTAVTKPSGPN
jgi:hypothetical protein